MTMARYPLTIQDEAGNLIHGASVEVRSEAFGAPLAALKSDRAGTAALPNPFVATDGADAGFHVAGGVYKIRVYTGPSVAPTFERVWRYVGIGLNSESDVVGAGEGPTYLVPVEQTSGTSNHLVVTPIAGVSLINYGWESVFVLRAAAANSGEMTMDVAGLTDGDIRNLWLPSGLPVPANFFAAGDLVMFHFNPTTGNFYLDLPTSPGKASDPYAISNAANAAALAVALAGEATAASSSGVWVPVLTFATPGDLSVTYSAQMGAWSKNGRLVTAPFVITTSAFTHTTASGPLQVHGLPFTSENVSGQNSFGQCFWGGVTKAGYTQINSRNIAGTAIISFVASGSGVANAAVSAADLPSGGSIVLQGTIVLLVD